MATSSTSPLHHNRFVALGEPIVIFVMDIEVWRSYHGPYTTEPSFPTLNYSTTMLYT